MFLANFSLRSTFTTGRLTIPELVDLHGSRGYGVIALTDRLLDPATLVGRGAGLLNLCLHSGTFPLYQAIIASEARRAWSRYRMVVLPGFTWTSRPIGGPVQELLAIGATSFLRPNQRPLTLARQIRAQGAVAVACRGFHGQSLGEFDAREADLRRGPLHCERDPEAILVALRGLRPTLPRLPRADVGLQPAPILLKA